VSRNGLAVVCLALGAAIAGGVALSGDERPHDPSIVRVELEGATGAADVATGFVVAPGRVVTVAHVLEPDRRLVVRGGNGVARRARVLRQDHRDDLALLAVPGLTAVPFRGASASGTHLLVRRGRGTAALRTAIRRRVQATVRGPSWGPFRRPALELATSVELGDSGAPLVDDGGRVAGVLFARASDGRRTAWAVGASAVSALLSR
jgi:S1-C subfamily serine protease